MQKEDRACAEDNLPLYWHVCGEGGGRFSLWVLRHRLVLAVECYICDSRNNCQSEYVLRSKYRGYKCEIRLGNVNCCCVRILRLCVRCRGRTPLCVGVEATVKKMFVREGLGVSLCKTTTLFHSVAQTTSWFAPWGLEVLTPSNWSFWPRCCFGVCLLCV